MSTIVVMKGDAMTEGSSLITFAPIGSIAPISFASTMATNTVALTAATIIRYCGSVWNFYADELTDMAVRFANSAASILQRKAEAELRGIANPDGGNKE